MTNLKNLLLLSILCSLVLLNACSEEDSAAIEAASKATLSVTASPSEGGTISPQGGTYDAGTTVELTATANVDYTFTGWIGDFEGSSNPVTLTMLNDQTLTANFEFQDADGDGVGDSVDNCAETSSGATVDENGCADSQKDTDGDGVTDDVDICPDSLEGETVDENGCAGSQKDTDGDGVSDDLDICPQSEEGADVNDSGCNNDAIYLDENGVTMKATEDAIIGESYNYQNTTYLIVDESTLRQMIVANEDVSKVITSRVTNLFELFKDNSSFNQDISSWDVSNVTSMQNLFLSATSFNQDISSWDVGNVNTMRSTFNSAASFNQDISSWDVSNVGNMRAMFAASYHATIFNQDIGSWDVSKVIDMVTMFYRAPFNNDISSWDVSSVFQMNGMFAESSFDQNIGSWDVSNVADMSGMFDTSPFNQDIGNWDVSNVYSMSGMFWLATAFNQDISSWNVYFVKNMENMFRSSYDGTNYESSFNQDLSSWNVDNVVSSENFSLDASNWTEPKPNFSQNTFRTDAYSSFLKLAIPGSTFTGLITDGFDDVHADIVGSGTNIQYALTGSATEVNLDTVVKWGADGYGTSVFTQDAGQWGTATETQLNWSSSDFVIEGYVYMDETFARPPFWKVPVRHDKYFVSADFGNPNPVVAGSMRMRLTLDTSEKGQTQYVSSNVSYNLNQWYHIAWVRTGNQLRYYFDGNNVYATSFSGGSIDTNGTLYRIMRGESITNDGAAGSWQDFRVYIGTDKGYTTETITPPLSMVEKL